MSDLNTLCNDALALWLDVAKVETGPAFRGNLKAWKLRAETEAVAKSRALDPSGLTTLMMLLGLFHTYMAERVFTAYDLLVKPAETEAALGPLRKLRSIFHNNVMERAVADFQAELRKAAIALGARDMAEFNAMLDDPLALGAVRRDALRSAETLHAWQFSQGEPEASTGGSLGLNTEVFLFGSMAAFVGALRAQGTPGITLAAIRGETADTFFAIGIRDGETITVLTDQVPEPYPGARCRSRNPDRARTEQVEKHRFPYARLTAELEKHGTALVVSGAPNAPGIPLCDLGDLPVGELAWTILLANALRQTYGVEQRRLPSIACTHIVPDRPDTKIGLALHHGALALTSLRAGTLLAAEHAMPTKSEGRAWIESTGENGWMLDRFRTAVDAMPEDALLPHGNHSVLRLLKAARTAEPHDASADLITMVSPKLATVDPTWFGTVPELRRRLAWTARWNQARIVEQMARDEFEETRASVMEWYRATVTRNAPALFDAAARGELLGPIERCGFAGENVVRGWHVTEGNLLVQSYGVTPNAEVREKIRPSNLTTQGDVGVNVTARPSGALDLTSSHARVWTLFVPTGPEALALLAGVPVSELPVPLQHWHAEPAYEGNSILQPVDPLAQIQNPWRALSLRVLASHTMNEINAHRKALGLPPSNLKIT